VPKRSVASGSQSGPVNLPSVDQVGRVFADLRRAMKAVPNADAILDDVHRALDRQRGARVTEREVRRAAELLRVDADNLAKAAARVRERLLAKEIQFDARAVAGYSKGGKFDIGRFEHLVDATAEISQVAATLLASAKARDTLRAAHPKKQFAIALHVILNGQSRDRWFPKIYVECLPLIGFKANANAADSARRIVRAALAESGRTKPVPGQLIRRKRYSATDVKAFLSLQRAMSAKPLGGPGALRKKVNKK
jgi:hypothetical protein